MWFNKKILLKQIIMEKIEFNRYQHFEKKFIEII